MDSFLIVQRGDEIGRRVDLSADQITIGRGSDNDVILNDPMVSRYHAVLKRQGDQYGMIDLGSSNPVVVNDQGLEPGIARQLAHRDVLLIGRNVFSFQQRSGATSGGQGNAPMQRPATPPPAMSTVVPAMVEHETKPTPAPSPAPVVADADRTMFTPPPRVRAPQGDHDKTMIGGGPEPLAPPPPPHFAPPPTVQLDEDDSPTNVGVKAPQGDRMIGTPPSEEEGELPTQIIPRR